MEVLVRLNDEEMSCVKDYALRHNTSLSELFVSSVMEKIEDEYDLSIYNKAMENILVIVKLLLLMRKRKN